MPGLKTAAQEYNIAASGVRRALNTSTTGPPPIDHCSLILYAAEIVNASSEIEETIL